VEPFWRDNAFAPYSAPPDSGGSANPVTTSTDSAPPQNATSNSQPYTFYSPGSVIGPAQPGTGYGIDPTLPAPASPYEQGYSTPPNLSNIPVPPAPPSGSPASGGASDAATQTPDSGGSANPITDQSFAPAGGVQAPGGMSAPAIPNAIGDLTSGLDAQDFQSAGPDATATAQQDLTAQNVQPGSANVHGQWSQTGATATSQGDSAIAKSTASAGQANATATQQAAKLAAQVLLMATQATNKTNQADTQATNSTSKTESQTWLQTFQDYSVRFFLVFFGLVLIGGAVYFFTQKKAPILLPEMI